MQTPTRTRIGTTVPEEHSNCSNRTALGDGRRKERDVDATKTPETGRGYGWQQLRNGMDAVQRGVTHGNGSGGNTSARRTRAAATTNDVDYDDNDEGVEARVGAQGASERKEKRNGKMIFLKK